MVVPSEGGNLGEELRREAGMFDAVLLEERADLLCVDAPRPVDGRIAASVVRAEEAVTDGVALAERPLRGDHPVDRLHRFRDMPCERARLHHG